ncbi:hypothetical protein ACUN0G_25160 [Pseudomonas sp. 32A]|uniref:hypothetical protein n=1 Tax=Pseudomonas sp. 32A TaxID=651185 RepID=UPI0040464F97
MELEDRVEALEYLVCVLAQQANRNAGLMGGVGQQISDAMFMDMIETEKREKIEEALRVILRKVRNNQSGMSLT